jgi:hypothetical protein
MWLKYFINSQCRTCMHTTDSNLLCGTMRLWARPILWPLAMVHLITCSRASWEISHDDHDVQSYPRLHLHKHRLGLQIPIPTTRYVSWYRSMYRIKTFLKSLSQTQFTAADWSWSVLTTKNCMTHDPIASTSRITRLHASLHHKSFARVFSFQIWHACWPDPHGARLISTPILRPQFWSRPSLIKKEERRKRVSFRLPIEYDARPTKSFPELKL